MDREQVALLLDTQLRMCFADHATTLLNGFQLNKFFLENRSRPVTDRFFDTAGLCPPDSVAPLVALVYPT